MESCRVCSVCARQLPWASTRRLPASGMALGATSQKQCHTGASRQPSGCLARGVRVGAAPVRWLVGHTWVCTRACVAYWPSCTAPPALHAHVPPQSHS